MECDGGLLCVIWEKLVIYSESRLGIDYERSWCGIIKGKIFIWASLNVKELKFEEWNG